MADIALVTAGRVEIVGFPVRSAASVAGEAITAGAPCTYNATGKAVNADANGAGVLASVKGVADRTVGTGEALTLIQEGRIDGYNLDSQAYGARLFVSDTAGALADAAGTASLPVGTVEPATGNPVSAGHDKVLHVNIPA
jgi:hypothetical protein